MKSYKDPIWIKVCSVLEEVLKNMESSQCYSSACKTSFDSKSVPMISLCDYMNRIHNYTNCSESCYIVAFMYIDRALQNTEKFLLNRKNIHRILLIAIVLAIKYLDDVYSDNLFYSQVGGITIAEFNFLEAELISIIDCNIYVNPLLYSQYNKEVELQYQQIMERREKLEIMDMEIATPEVEEME